jgi:hypothetical protein
MNFFIMGKIMPKIFFNSKHGDLQRLMYLGWRQGMARRLRATPHGSVALQGA